MNAILPLEKTKHYPVMLNQVLSIIAPQRGGTYIDCTFGGGGYSKAILNFPDTKVIALDRDKLTKKYATDLEKKFPKRFTFFEEKFSNISKVVKKDLNPKAVIFDLGLSSFQLSDQKRGFSFESKNFLNMEMGINEHTAYDVVNNLDKEYLAKIIKVLGEEKDGKIIANKIDKHRSQKPIETSKELSSIINSAKKNYNSHKKNPSTKTFQAIRIFVNQELTQLIEGLIEATKLLSEGGLLIVISFHSLEDRIVKNFFKLQSNLRRNPSRYFPVKENESTLFNLNFSRPIGPDKREVIENIRSRSAKLRYGERNNNSFFYPVDFKNQFINYLKFEDMRV
jgi:16S rRNA (cytosine1402-N4)-methyltransferase